MTKTKDATKVWLVADRDTVHLDDQVIPPGAPFQGDASLIERGIARKASKNEVGGRDEG